MTTPEATTRHPPEPVRLHPCMKKAWVEFLGEPADGAGRVDAA